MTNILTFFSARTLLQIIFVLGATVAAPPLSVALGSPGRPGWMTGSLEVAPGVRGTCCASGSPEQPTRPSARRPTRATADEER